MAAWQSSVLLALVAGCDRAPKAVEHQALDTAKPSVVTAAPTPPAPAAVDSAPPLCATPPGGVRVSADQVADLWSAKGDSVRLPDGRLMPKTVAAVADSTKIWRIEVWPKRWWRTTAGLCESITPLGGTRHPA